MIDAADRIPRHSVKVVGRSLSVAMAGRGPAVVLLHGNGTHAYLWRNLIPYLAPRYRCIAPDLPGMGRSDIVFPSGPVSYSFAEQWNHVEILIELLEPDRPIVLIGHELGATLAIHFARMNPGRVAGLVLVEGVFRVSNDATFDADLRGFLSDLRTAHGEDRVLGRNAIIEHYLPRLTVRRLGPEEMQAYRAPYTRAGESRRAMLSMIRQLPIRSWPGPIDDLAEEARRWCVGSDVSKLVIGGRPGYLVPPAVLGTAARWKNTTTTAVRGLHFLTEDSPARITTDILDWLGEIGHRG